MDALQLAVTRARWTKIGNGHHQESNIEMRLAAIEKAVAHFASTLSTLADERRLEALERVVADIAARAATLPDSFPQKLTPVEKSESPRPPRPSIAKIKSVVSAAYNLTPNDLESQQRGKKIVWPRQIAVYLACRLTPQSLPTIGKHFGGRDHTTVLNSRNKVAELRATNEGVRNEVAALEAQLA